MSANPSTATNPYEPPAKLVMSAEDAVSCSFCNRPHQIAGPLVVGTTGSSYLCETCAKAAAQMLETRKPSNRLISVLAMVILAGAGTLVLWDTFFSDEPSLPSKQLCLLVALFAGWFVWVEFFVPNLGRRFR